MTASSMPSFEGKLPQPDQEKAYEHRFLHCVSCQKEFAFTIGEQRFYGQRGYEDPRHCPDCREERRVRREEAGSLHRHARHDPRRRR